MGRDKASMEVGGEPLAVLVVRALRSLGGDVIVASGDGHRLGWLGERQVADALPDAGPLGGIVAGLEAAASDLAAVVAVDMPYASAAVLLALADARRDEDAVVPRTEGG